MRYKISRRASAAIWVLCAIIVSSCTHYELSDRPLAYNVALQDAQNRQVLLNIVRASREYPLYFTATGQITSTGIADGSTLGLTLPFGPDAKGNYTLSPSLRLQEGLSVASTNLYTQEFYQGFLAPVKTSLVDYYLKYGWNKNLIFYAFIREIDLDRDYVIKLRSSMPLCESSNSTGNCISLPDQEAVSPQCKSKWSAETAADKPKMIHFVNSPKNICQFHKFQYLITQLENLNLRTQLKQKNDNQPNTKPSSFVLPDKENNLTITVKSGKADAKTDSEYDFVVGENTGNCKASEHAAAPEQSTAEAQIYVENSTGRAAACPASSGNIIIRSPEAMIFYLGEIVSADDGGALKGDDASTGRVKFPTYITLPSGTTASLFHVDNDTSGNDDAVVSVPFENKTYYIRPPQNEDQTMHLMSLVEQVLALQQKGSELPTVPTVQVLGQ